MCTRHTVCRGSDVRFRAFPLASRPGRGRLVKWTRALGRVGRARISGGALHYARMARHDSSALYPDTVADNCSIGVRCLSDVTLAWSVQVDRRSARLVFRGTDVRPCSVGPDRNRNRLLSACPLLLSGSLVALLPSLVDWASTWHTTTRGRAGDAEAGTATRR
jgi:hypothetical protein